MMPPLARSLLVWWTLCGYGCAQHEVVVGDTIEELDLTRCAGKRTRCADALPEPDALELDGELVTCAGDADPVPRGFAWQTQIESAGLQAATDSDGALWIAGTVQDLDPAASKYWLAVDRLSPTGQLLFHTELYPLAEHDLAMFKVISLALDARGHAFVLLEAVVADRARGWTMFVSHLIVELDPTGEQVEAPLAIDGAQKVQPPLLTASSDGSLILSATSSAGSPVIARLDGDRRLVWLQNRTAQTSALALASDATGGSFVRGTSLSVPAEGFNESMTRYDANGNMVWEVKTRMVTSALDVTEDGGVVLFGRHDDPSPAVVRSSLVKLDAAGDPLWSLTFDQNELALALMAGQQTAVDADGYTYFLAATSAPGQYALNRVSPDGGECKRASLVSVDRVQNFYVTRDGALYGIVEGTAEGTLAGRFER